MISYFPLIYPDELLFWTLHKSYTKDHFAPFGAGLHPSKKIISSLKLLPLLSHALLFVIQAAWLQEPPAFVEP